MTVVLVLYCLGFAVQLAGVFIVVRDVRGAIENRRKLRADIDAAAEQRQSQLDRLSQDEANPLVQQLGLGSWVNVGRAAVDQIGPAARMKSQAFADYIDADSNTPGWLRWLGVSLLVLGLGIDFAANLLSLAL